MKTLHLGIILTLLSVAPAFAQNVRFGPYELPSVSNLYPPLLQANLGPNSPVLSVCHSPANNGAGMACTNYATTYTGLGVACPNGAQDTPDPNSTISACQVTGDAQGNVGWWAPPGQYDFTICVQTTCFGPYTVTEGSAGTSGGITVNGGSVLLYPVNLLNDSVIDFLNPSGSNITATINNGAVTNAMLVNSSTTVNGTPCTLGSSCTLTKLNALRCESGLGDGLNAVPAGTYLQAFCYNDSGVTWTITGIKCFTDNSGSSTLNASGHTLGALLTGALTCSNSFAAGTQSANVALTSGDWINFTWVADGTSKQTTWVVSITQ